MKWTYEASIKRMTVLEGMVVDEGVIDWARNIVVIVGHHLQDVSRLPGVASSKALGNAGLDVLADVPASWPVLYHWGDCRHITVLSEEVVQEAVFSLLSATEALVGWW